MKLYDVPRNSIIRVKEDYEGPPGAPSILAGDVLKFSHIDGMYSLCMTQTGQIVHLEAWAEVEVLNEL